ncbi:MAG: glycosyltransferase family 39 protein [Bdellovibrionales bacterium]|nr:glycosyltransferase family 39 protein [Bdellovibrionales bacterium]
MKLPTLSEQPGPEPSPRETILWLTLICGIGVLLRLRFLTEASVWLDEGYTLLLSRLSVGTLLERWPCDANPLLASRVFSWWSALFGDSQRSLELVSLIAGSLTPIAIGLFVARFFGRRAALWAALLTAGSAFHIAFSQFIRVYALAVLICVLAAWVVAEYLRQPSARRGYLAIALIWLLVNLHYLGGLVAAGFFVGALLITEDRPQVRRALMGYAAVTLLLLAPTGVQLWQQYVSDYRAAWIDSSRLTTSASVWYHLASESVLLLVVLLSAVFYSYIFPPERVRRFAGDIDLRPLLLSWIVVPFLIAFALSFLGNSFFHVRYFVFVFPPFIMLASLGLSRLPVSLDVIAALPLVLVASTNAVSNYYVEQYARVTEREDYEYLRAHYRDGDIVIHSSKCSFVASYFYTGGLPDEYLFHATNPTRVMECGGVGEPTVSFREAKGRQRLWLMHLDCYPHQATADIFHRKSFEDLRPRLQYESPDGNLLLFSLQNEPIVSQLDSPQEAHSPAFGWAEVLREIGVENISTDDAPSEEQEESPTAEIH